MTEPTELERAIALVSSCVTLTDYEDVQAFEAVISRARRADRMEALLEAITPVMVHEKWADVSTTVSLQKGNATVTMPGPLWGEFLNARRELDALTPGTGAKPHTCAESSPNDDEDLERRDEEWFFDMDGRP